MADDGQFPTGATLGGVRDHNERVILSTINRLSSVPGSELARQTGLSAQTVSVILRKLEADGLLARGTPQRGRVGKPSVPMTLHADGTFSVGLKIGRRSTDLALMDFLGQVRMQKTLTYRVPDPDAVFQFFEEGLAAMLADMPGDLAERVCGLGVAAPFEIWKWHEALNAPQHELDRWKDVDFGERIAAFSDLDWLRINDATAACLAENALGQGTQLRDYAYMFIGSFIGGGIVLNGAVYQGPHGNAGALGPIRMPGATSKGKPLLDTASLYLLEDAIAEAGRDPATLWRPDRNWAEHEPQLSIWIDETAEQIARASLSICSVIDFPAIVIDGAFPTAVRAQLVDRVRQLLPQQDSRGLVLPRIEEGQVGENARSIGAAYVPIAARHFTETVR